MAGTLIFGKAAMKIISKDEKRELALPVDKQPEAEQDQSTPEEPVDPAAGPLELPVHGRN